MSLEPWLLLTGSGRSENSDRAEATEEQRTVKDRNNFILLHNVHLTQTPVLNLGEKQAHGTNWPSDEVSGLEKRDGRRKSERYEDGEGQKDGAWNCLM